MAPAASRLRVESELGSLPKRALAQYLLFLKFYPVVTKAVSSGILSALGNLLAQMIEKKQKKDSRSLEVSGLLRYLVYGLFVTGPLSHYLYLFMEYWVPPEVPWARVKRLLLDRLFFAPTFLLLFFFVMNLLEGKNISVFVAKMRSGFWPALQMNWRMWTPLQFININYVPLQVVLPLALGLILPREPAQFFQDLVLGTSANFQTKALCLYTLKKEKFRVLFANMAALFWYAYLASLGK